VPIGRSETVDVAFAANNAGVWMLNCYVLLHAGMGMTTSVNYVGKWTPIEMGRAPAICRSSVLAGTPVSDSRCA
jgi:hypothetical protein